MNKEIFNQYLIKYLESQGIKVNKRGNLKMTKCIYCNLDAPIIPKINEINCFRCNKQINILDCIRYLEQDKKDWEDQEIYQYLKEKFNINITTEKDVNELDVVLDFYEKSGFCCTPAAINNKECYEKERNLKEHKDKNEWKQWIGNRQNLAIRTGKCSNLTVFEIEQKNIPDEIKNMLGEVLMENSTKGYHCFYLYEPDLIHVEFEAFGCKLEVLNDLRTCTVTPSIVKDVRRKFVTQNVLKGKARIIKMPTELKELILKNQSKVIKTSSGYKKDVDKVVYRKPLIREHQGRSELFMHLSGQFRKIMPKENVMKSLYMLDRVICDPPLGEELEKTVFKSLDNYDNYDNTELRNDILKYLKKAGAVTKTDICMAVKESFTKGLEKIKIDEEIHNLVKENYMYLKGRKYYLVKKHNWKTDLINIVKPLDFKVPFVDKTARFNWGSQILIGGIPGTGKTTVCISMIKRLVKQGIKPYLIELEPSKNFIDVALSVGLKPGDFIYDDEITDPMEIRLENKAVTIIDWILPENYAEVDKLFYRFNKELHRTKGFLIIFMQLRDDGKWFSINLAHFFSCFSARFLLNDKYDDREYSRFIIDKNNNYVYPYTKEICCKYIKEISELKTIEEIKQEEKNGIKF